MEVEEKLIIDVQCFFFAVVVVSLKKSFILLYFYFFCWLSSKSSHAAYQEFMNDDIIAPSPCDSNILETALRERESELAHLRQTMEHNEKVIFKVHQVGAFTYIYVDKIFIFLINLCDLG